jgi:hypothetical protein
MRMGLGLGLGLGSQRGGGVSYSDEAAAYFAAMAVQPSAAQRAAINARIVAIKARAGLWDKFDILCFYDIHAEQAALLNVKYPAGAFNQTNNGTTFTAFSGFKGGGTGQFIDTNYTPSTDKINASQHSFSMGLWVYESTEALDRSDCGVISTTDTLIHSYRVAGVAIGRINTGTPVSAAVANALGLTVVSRTGNAGAPRIDLYRNTSSSLANNTAACGDLPDLKISVCATRSSGTGAHNPTSRGIKAFFIASGFTGDDVAALYAAINSNPVIA